MRVWAITGIGITAPILKNYRNNITDQGCTIATRHQPGAVFMKYPYHTKELIRTNMDI